ncbi:glucosaminidase domain-containing protein [Aliikangiella maris]|uniref:Glucosaminidase domain-containing protein n=2 Tax=Aliikangiella maris TaxID=3162458 RepID=A0ABV3MSB3_9GAMM
MINQSVGEGGQNQKNDTLTVQQLLNHNHYLIPDIKTLDEDGLIGPMTINAIRTYQAKVVGMNHPDGLVEPSGITLKTLINNKRKPRPANVCAFIDKTLTAAQSVNAKYRVPVSIIIAQAALESGWGRAVKDNAYFGIKAHNTQGSTTTFTTTEYENGNKITIEDSFRAYADFAEAAEDYGHFLTTNPRYSQAFLYANEPDKFAEELQKAGYATDPQYANKLKSIISTYYLDDFDQ